MLGWRYYWTDISDVVNENFTPTYFFYGKNDLYMQRMCYSQQGPLLERELRESGAVYECHVYENAPHAIGPAATPMRTAGSGRQRHSGKNSANKEINGGLL